MKDHLKRIVEAQDGMALKLCVAREYLQARLLQSLQESGVFMRWAFLGGTALRFLYSLPRYSEDLDFSLVEGVREAGFRIALENVKHVFEAENVTLNLQHYDKASLLAGKLHAVLSRTYSKGRDLYDLVWYVSDRSWPGPNLVLLNAALGQTGWKGAALTPENWRSSVRNRLSQLDWAKARDDVLPFLERENDLQLVAEEMVLGLLGKD